MAVRLPFLALVVASGLFGCKRNTPTAGVSTGATATSPADASTAAAGGASSAPAAAGPCHLSPEYRGEIATLHVFMRLGEDTQKLTGRYFYERYGIDIPLSGTLSADGTLRLVEGTAAAPTGRFEGRCEGPGGVLSGLWKKKADAAGVPFHLAPIVPGDVPIAATKRVTILGPRPAAHATQCKYEETRIELFGLRDPGVTRAMNQQGLETRTEPMFDADDVRAVQGCAADGSDAVEATFTQTLVRSFRELATLSRSGGHMVAGAAHPDSGIDFDLATWDLRTGARVAARDVLARDVTELLVRCAAKEHPESEGVQPDNGWQELAANVDLTEKGVHFFAVGFPHFAAALIGQGPVIPYGVLLRDGFLKKDSAVKRAWEGVAPAGKDVDACAGAWQ
jgi:hypothetical protein